VVVEAGSGAGRGIERPAAVDPDKVRSALPAAASQASVAFMPTG
jgi:hypothetical protein